MLDGASHLAGIPVWKLGAFVSEFRQIHDQMADRRFAFVLGAGASKTSGILTGEELVNRWIKEIRERSSGDTDLPVSEWATAERLGIAKFRYTERAAFYPQVYERRFAHDPESGFAYLENLALQAKPSLGYCVLARILAETRHKVVVTTNFDNLVAEAFAMVADTAPLVCGHESLAGFVVPAPRRPVIAKIHRDLLLKPKNQPNETDALEDEWRGVLEGIFRSYTPIVVGYGGNDGSLMGFLEEFRERPYPGPLFWCQRVGSTPSSRVEELLRKHRGILVVVDGFDDLLAVLGDAVVKGSMIELVEERYRRQVERLQEETQAQRERLEQRASEQEESVQLARSAIRDAVERDLEYLRRGDPRDYVALARLGTRLVDEERWDEAEAVLRDLLELNAKLDHDVQKARTHTNLARALQGAGKISEARQHYEEALRIVADHGTPEDRAIVQSLWALLEKADNRLGKAAELLKAAIAIDKTTGRHARLAFDARTLAQVSDRLGDADAAIEMYQLAARNSELAGNLHWVARNLGELGTLHRRLGNWTEAKAAYEKSIEIAEGIADNVSLAITYDNLGVVNAILGETDLAESHFRASAWLDEQSPYPGWAGKSYGNLGLIYWQEGKKKRAELHFNRAASLFDEADMADLLKRLTDVRDRLGRGEPVRDTDYF